MKYFSQEKNYSCGASAIRNCISALGGVIPSEKYIRRIAQTNIQGTTADGIIRAFLKLNYSVDTVYSENENTYKDKILKLLKSGKVLITITDNESHWIAVTGYENKKIIFIDSDFKKIKQEYTVNEFVKVTRNIVKKEKINYWFSIIAGNIEK